MALTKKDEGSAKEPTPEGLAPFLTISIPLTHRLVLYALEAGECLFCVQTPGGFCI